MSNRFVGICLSLALLLPGCGSARAQEPDPSAEAATQMVDPETVSAEAASAENAAAETNVNPGINERFVGEDATVEGLQNMLESESREVFVHREAIVEALGIEAGMAVADVGAGTGIFLELMAEAVGPDGALYAVDIAPHLVDLLGQIAREGNHDQVTAVLGDVRSVNLAPGSVDLLFTCDTYHHFEYPMTTLSTIREALRPGGEFVVLDFEKIPGVSREFIMGHVRADKETVIEEITSAGFVLVEEVNLDVLEENYLLRFRVEP